MNDYLLYILESSVCLGVFYLFYVTVLHNQTSYQYNRFYLLLASFLSFVLPLLQIPIGFSSGTSAMKGSAEGYLLLNPIGINQAGEASQSISLPAIVTILYATGAALALFFFVKQLFHLIKIIRRHKHFTKDRYAMVHTEGKLPASSFFHYLFWDDTQQLDFYEQQQIITHEEAHIRYGHSYDIVYMALLKIVFWFHPLVYLYEKALIETHEFMADAEVLQRTHPKEYARLLTKSLFNHMELSLVNHFYKSRTLKRIEMMNLKNKKTPWYKLVLVAPIALTVFFVFSCQPDEEAVTREAVAQSYEEVQAALSKAFEQQQAIALRYYDNAEEFRKATYEKGDAIKALKAANISDKDLAAYKTLTDTQEDLHKELTKLPDANGIFTVVENQPEPVGGMKEFYGYIAQNLKYPVQARRMGIEGKVFIQFVVDEYGEITEVTSIKGIGAGCDAEAERVLKDAAPWKAGETNGKAVPVRMVLPITFKLNGSNTPNNSKMEDGRQAG